MTFQCLNAGYFLIYRATTEIRWVGKIIWWPSQQGGSYFSDIKFKTAAWEECSINPEFGNQLAICLNTDGKRNDKTVELGKHKTDVSIWPFTGLRGCTLDFFQTVNQQNKKPPMFPKEVHPFATDNTRLEYRPLHIQALWVSTILANRLCSLTGTIWKYLSVQRSPISDTALVCVKFPKLRPLVILV